MTAVVTAPKRLLLCTVVLAAPFSEAAVVPWLYNVEVAVTSQADAERRRAGQAALSTLLARLTGLREIPHTPDVRDALQRPEDFYTSYRFERRVQNETVLTIRFEPASAQGLLRRAGLPIWAADRPTVLVWLVLQRGAERERLADAQATAFAAALQAQARARGLEVFLALDDLQDRELEPADLWGRFWERIDAASARYAPDLLLVGRSREENDGTWHTMWNLRGLQDVPTPSFHGGIGRAAPRRSLNQPALPTAAFQQRSPSVELVAQTAVDNVAAVLADRFAVRGGLKAIDVTVRGAQTVRGYAALLAHLKSREYIERLEIDLVTPDAMRLRLHSRSSPDQLRELLTIAGQFEAEQRADAPSASRVTGRQAPELTLLWQGRK